MHPLCRCTRWIAIWTIIGTIGLANAEPFGGTLQRIKETGVIRVGHRQASIPLSYLDAAGQPVGYTIDLCRRIIAQIKKELRLPELRIEFASVIISRAISMLESHAIDIECGSTTYNLTRSKRVDFLFVTYITGVKLLVKKVEGIKELEDLNGRNIALARGSTTENVIKQAAAEKGLDLTYHMVKDHPEGWEALKSGRVDAYASDEVLLYGLISQSLKPADYEVVESFLSYEPYAIMIRHGDTDLRTLGNSVLADLMRSGKIFKIYDKWFNPGPTNIQLPLSNMLKNAFLIYGLPL